VHIRGELLLAVEPVAQGLALDVRHHVVRGAVQLAAVDEPEDVRVLQAGDGPDLAQEALRADDGGELGLTTSMATLRWCLRAAARRVGIIGAAAP
jgi:hypothetical protein